MNVLLLELVWSQIAQTRLRALPIVLSSPLLDDDFRFAPISEPAHVQAFIAEPTIERFIDAVLPRFAWLDECRPDSCRLEPILQRLGNELRAIVRADMHGSTMKCNQASDFIDDAACADRALHVDGERLLLVLVNYVESTATTADLLARQNVLNPAVRVVSRRHRSGKRSTLRRRGPTIATRRQGIGHNWPGAIALLTGIAID